jgi:hypothetical protein
MAHWYRGRCYPSPLKAKVKTTIKHIASRAWESIQGDHPAGGEALVERMIREYPDPSNKSDKGE